jgi:hypothetical protein
MRKRQRQAGNDTAGVTRRLFLTVAGAGAAMLPSLVSAQAPAVTKDALRPMVDVAELAITDEQLAKLAGLVGWSRGELRKLRDVETGLLGPAPMYLPPLPTARSSDHE